jgi:hypothetical protein
VRSPERILPLYAAAEKVKDKYAFLAGVFWLVLAKTAFLALPFLICGLPGMLSESRRLMRKPFQKPDAADVAPAPQDGDGTFESGSSQDTPPEVDDGLALQEYPQGAAATV